METSLIIIFVVYFALMFGIVALNMKYDLRTIIGKVLARIIAELSWWFFSIKSLVLHWHAVFVRASDYRKVYNSSRRAALRFAMTEAYDDFKDILYPILRKYSTAGNISNSIKASKEADQARWVF